LRPNRSMAAEPAKAPGTAPTLSSEAYMVNCAGVKMTRSPGAVLGWRTPLLSPSMVACTGEVKPNEKPKSKGLKQQRSTATKSRGEATSRGGVADASSTARASAANSMGASSSL